MRWGGGAIREEERCGARGGGGAAGNCRSCCDRGGEAGWRDNGWGQGDGAQERRHLRRTWSETAHSASSSLEMSRLDRDAQHLISVVSEEDEDGKGEPPAEAQAEPDAAPADVAASAPTSLLLSVPPAPAPTPSPGGAGAPTLGRRSS